MTTVLIVDDSLTVRMDLADALGAAGFTPVPCASLAEARVALATKPIVLAILDVRLPDGDGIDFLHELRTSTDHAALPILMLSSESEVKHRVRGLRMGANDYVGKPYDANFVIARVRELVVPRADGGVPLVLVIDDSPTFRESLVSSLASAGYRTITAASGTEGLRTAATNRPGAIIVDGVMPDLHGDAVIRRVRLDPALRTTPCLLLTGSDDAAAEIQALDAGADAFARKEADVAAVLARFAAMLRTAADSGHTAETSLLAPKRILVVDDDVAYLGGLAEQLQDDGYDVVQTSSSEEALDLLAVQQVDCILLDIDMPGLSGLEACRRIKGVPILRDIPMIAVTGIDDPSAVVAILATGADDVVSKAAGRDVVVARAKAQIRRKQFTDEYRHVREQLLRTEKIAAEERAARELAETRAALADQLAKANAELSAANRELEAFSYSVSHDLRAPLRTITSFSAALEEDAGGTLDPQCRDHLQRIVKATYRMGDLIEGLLALSRISKSGIRKVRVDLSALACELVDELRARHPERRVEVAIASGLEANADPRLARALLDNLLGNAWKFTSQRAQARIDVGTTSEHPNDERIFFVRDNGAGFDMSFAQKLFIPFQRLHGTEFPGTGIGLATVQRIIERHSGRIWAESAVGQGATIYFTLPS